MTRVTKVTESGNWWEVSTDEYQFGLAKSYGVEPRVGDDIECDSRGSEVRGVTLNGVVVFAKTDAELEDERTEVSRRIREQRLREFLASAAALDAEYAALPSEFRARIDGFRTHGGREWRVNYEAYELSCCTEAARLAAHCGTAEALLEFAKLEHAEQRAAFPSMGEGHSGNSWQHAMSFARCYLERPELLSKLHGALCPLVGCETSGCYATRGVT